METVSLISIITIALLGSFGHCIGMCGGIVVAYSSTKIKSNYTKTTQSIAHLLYSFGRVTTYTFLGAIFGFLGKMFSFSNLTSGILLLIAGVSMVLVGFSLLGKIKFLLILEQTCSKSNFYQKSFKKLLGRDSFFSFYFLGLLNGLLPCGFVYTFAIIATSTGSIYYGALVMFIFGICTIPALFFLGFFIGIFRQSNLRDIFIKIASILLILFGIYTVYKAYVFIKSPNNTANHHMMKH